MKFTVNGYFSGTGLFEGTEVIVSTYDYAVRYECESKNNPRILDVHKFVLELRSSKRELILAREFSSASQRDSNLESWVELHALVQRGVDELNAIDMYPPYALRGMRVTDVNFVHDYLQLALNETTFNLYVEPSVDGLPPETNPDAKERSIRAIVGSHLQSINETLDLGLDLKFSNDTRFRIGPNELRDAAIADTDIAEILAPDWWFHWDYDAVPWNGRVPLA